MYRPTRSSCAAIALFAAILCLWILAQPAQAQEFRQYKDFDRYRYLPRLPEGPERPPRLPDRPTEATGDPKVLVEGLKGLIFIDGPDMVVDGALDVTGIHVHSSRGLYLLETAAFHELASSYLGGPISIRRLNELVRDIITFYRQNDRPVVDVSIPEQDITDGVVQVIVTEGRVGQVLVRKPCYFDPRVLVRQVCISPGDEIFESVLLEDLRWLYRDPFRRVELELTPGENQGETDVIFNVYDRLPVRVYTGYEDTGTRATGLERTFYGVNWYNALRRDDDAGYQFTTSSDFSKLVAHSAFYSTALLNRDIITVYGTYAEFKAPVAAGLFDTNGATWQILPRWYRELCPIGCYEHAITAGMDLKETNTNLEFGGVQVFDTDADVVQFMLGYKGSRYDALGSTHIGSDFYYSPGNLSGGNKDANFQAIRLFAEANYFYTRAFFERRFWLPRNMEFVARFTGQLADGNLLPTEQLGLGGYNSVRGYDLYSVVGDSGFFVNLEIRTEPVWVFGCDELQLLGFYDFGNAYNHTLLPGEDPSVDLQGVGVGLRYQMQPNLTLRTDYGWQLSELATQPSPRQRWHIGVVLSH